MYSTKEEQYRSRQQRKDDVAQDGVARRTLSFYRYVPISDPAAMQEKICAEWSALGCLGRIYVANEGINAQMNVPVENWDAFDRSVQNMTEFKDMPYKIAVEEGTDASFYKLTIKTRDKIVADGLDDASFDPSNTGSYLTAEQMNDYVDDPDAVVIDMRNAYEAEIGHFEGAQTMDVDSFRDQLASVEQQFADKKNKKIALYCTGGIRCEKASAWMKHKGFSDVHHVKGGIIDYARQIKEKDLQNKFRGKNFVFDERMGERVGDEVIATCHVCEKNKADDHYHCDQQWCHVLHIACDDCRTKYKGNCSRRCQLISRLPKQPAEKLSALLVKNKETGTGKFRKNRMGV